MNVKEWFKIDKIISDDQGNEQSGRNNGNARWKQKGCCWDGLKKGSPCNSFNTYITLSGLI